MADMNSKERILRAAADVAREAGAGHLSLDAVAAKAGLSKGGLLYNFPSKAKLLEALVASHVESFERELAEEEEAGPKGRNHTALAYLAVFEKEVARAEQPPAGLLAAIVDDPSLLAPVRPHMRALLDRMADGKPEPLIAYLVVEGLRATRLFDTDTLTATEKEAVFRRLRTLLAER